MGDDETEDRLENNGRNGKNARLLHHHPACCFDTILRDVMGLTKINFNSCLHNDRLPVTIRFADAVGEIMLAAPNG